MWRTSGTRRVYMVLHFLSTRARSISQDCNWASQTGAPAFLQSTHLWSLVVQPGLPRETLAMERVMPCGFLGQKSPTVHRFKQKAAKNTGTFYNTSPAPLKAQDLIQNHHGLQCSPQKPFRASVGPDPILKRTLLPNSLIRFKRKHPKKGRESMEKNQKAGTMGRNRKYMGWVRRETLLYQRLQWRVTK